MALLVQDMAVRSNDAVPVEGLVCIPDVCPDTQNANEYNPFVENSLGISELVFIKEEPTGEDENSESGNTMVPMEHSMKEELEVKYVNTSGFDENNRLSLQGLMSRSNQFHSLWSNMPEFMQTCKYGDSERKYICYNCGMKFSRKFGIKRHLMRTCNKNNKLYGYVVDSTRISVEKYQCQICSKQFPKKYNMERHIHEVHKIEWLYNCKGCDERFYSKDDLSLHSKDCLYLQKDNIISSTNSHSLSLKLQKTKSKCKNYKKDSEYTCEICGKVVASKYNIRRHLISYHTKMPKDSSGEMKNVNKEKKFQCSICSCKFYKKYNAYRHINEVHRKGSKFKCSECYEKFQCKEDLEVHLNSHTGKSKYQCGICNKLFSSKSYKCKHENTIHINDRKSNVNKKYQCKICSKTFSRNHSLKRHTKEIHRREWSYQCGECHERFTRKSDLVSHMNFHLRKYDCQCKVCGNVFSSNIHTNLHMKVFHTLDKKYQCNICSKSFVLKSRLRRHISSVHRKERKYECAKCNKKFAEKGCLKTHVNIVHDDIRNSMCHLCGKRYINKSCLSNHVSSVHDKIRSFGCGECGKIFLSKANLKTHVHYVHLKVRKFQCEICFKWFFDRRSVGRHVNVIHHRRQ